MARDDRPNGGTEVTEYLPRGEYRVTRCTESGRLVVSQTVAPLRDTNGAVALVPTVREEPGVKVAAIYGDTTEPNYAEAFAAEREELLDSVIPPTRPLPAPPVGLALAQVAANPGTGCSSGQFTLWIGAWRSRSYSYRVNRRSFNFNDTSVASIVRGHRNWDTTRNGCGLKDITNLTSRHLGSTTAVTHTSPDGMSVVDRGDMANVGCPGALACTMLFALGSGLTETDQRYSKDVRFSNAGAAGAYDYQSIATHETGHSIGLNHASSSRALTMYFATTPGTTYARTLASGDVRGLRARYP